MTPWQVDLFLSGDMGLWVLERTPVRHIARVFSADKRIAEVAVKKGLRVIRRDPNRLFFKPSRIGLSVHYPRVFGRALIRSYEKMYNLHPGFLPWGRGYYPVFWALWEKTPAGATLHEIVPRLDGGPIVGQTRVSYAGSDTGGSLHRRVRLAEKRLFMKFWPRIVKGQWPRTTRQGRTGGSYHSREDFFRLKRRADALGPDGERLARCFCFPGYPGIERCLALLGGRPAFKDERHVGTPNIGNRRSFLRRVERILDSRWLTNAGPYEREFEAKIARLSGVRHCIAVCNATIALQIAVRALNLKGEVIVPSFTFVATAHALQWEEISPVFCDIDEQSLTIDPRRVEALIGPRTTGIIGVHLWGRPCNVEALGRIARHHRLKLIFDAAHAFGCRHKGRPIGGFGDAEVLSFHATKFMNTFEGGAILTNNDTLAAQVRLMKNFGFAGYDNVIYLGTNGKMSEISAAMGLSGLESMRTFVAVNKRNYLAYAQCLKGIPGVSLIPYNMKERSNYQYITVRIDQQKAGLHRDDLLKALWAERVLARRYFYPGCHRMEPYRSQNVKHSPLDVTERVLSETLSLPTGTAVTPEDVRIICDLIRCSVANAPSVVKAVLRFRKQE